MAENGTIENSSEAPELRVRGLTLGFIARATLVVIALYALADVLWKGRDVLFIAFFAVLVASFLSIFASWLHERGLPRPLAAVLVLAGVLALLGGLVWLGWPSLQEQLAVLQRQLPAALNSAGDWFQSQWRQLTGQLGEPNPQVRRQVEQRLAQEFGQLVSGAVPLLNTVVGALGGLLIVLFAGLFLAVDPRTYADGLALLVPRSGRVRVTEALVAVGGALRQWMLGTLISMTIVGLLTWIGLTIVGVPAALVLAVIAGLLEFVPYFGPMMSAVPGLAIALTVSPGTALWTLVVYAGVQALESNVIHPLVMKETVHLPPALTILWVSLMGVLFGFLGLFLAVPILAAAKVLVQMLYIDEVANAS